ncbi:hypothetical protein NE857_01795 [Nocardiopsis exhalans]|uniref:Uncharacterized protein n=1 Tax=Nocardiopsis exhalans TaxID=163604 RepID=A0ABY5D8S9_9ACTN|nr:hypothetical protein [Nocardiopsis exhalans]USY20422.1 hypothetical protein NE857_01795 [Nocardiopsis exhalans]
MSRHTSLTRVRAAATGESHSTAAKAVTALPAGAAIIPEASQDQAHLETDLLLGLRELITMGPPYDPPLGIARRTPAPDGIILEIARPHLTDALTLWMPHSDNDGEFHGIPGLRARHHGRHLQLHHLALDAIVHIPASRAQWAWARDRIHAAHTHLGEPFWAQVPRALTALERDTLATRREYFKGPGMQDSTRLGSALLRRLGLLTTHQAKGVAGYADLWRGLPWSRHGGFPVHLEWGRAHHVAALAEQLTDEASAVALPQPLRQRVERDPRTSTIQIRSDRDIEVQLRPCPVSADGPLWGWEERLPLHGSHRVPQHRRSHLLPATVHSILVEAFSGEYDGVLASKDLQITPRDGGGWDVTGLGRLSRPVEFLRFLAMSNAFPALWPNDLQDATDVYSSGRALRMVRICGVDVAFD